MERVNIPVMVVLLLKVVFNSVDFTQLWKAGFGCHVPFASQVAVIVSSGMNPVIQR
jgi:hypothetical protein